MSTVNMQEKPNNLEKKIFSRLIKENVVCAKCFCYVHVPAEFYDYYFILQIMRQNLSIENSIQTTSM